MKKRILLFMAITMIACYSVTAQVSITADSSSTNASSILEIRSTDKGFLPPRMTTVERDAIISPAVGLIIYNTDDKNLQFFDGILWSSPTGEFICGYQMADAEDNAYSTILIGTQCWMAENLAYLPQVSPSSQGNNTDPYYYVYGYQGSNVAEARATDNYQNYGVLYNWTSAQNACPEGWHLPTDAEWTILYDYLGGTSSYAGGKMKSTRTVPDPHPRWEFPNTGATNSCGFSGLPGGFRYGVDFGDLGLCGHCWSSTEYDTDYAYCLVLSHKYTFVTQPYELKNRGLSVRCIRD